MSGYIEDKIVIVGINVFKQKCFHTGKLIIINCKQKNIEIIKDKRNLIRW